jgi:hypothetical protein
MAAYANEKKLDDMIQEAVASIEQGKPVSDLTAMIKNAPTGMLLASALHDTARYMPGNKLVTYNGVDKDGKPIQETYNGGVAVLTENSVILRSAEPIRYPEGHKLAGVDVLGEYNTDGTFVVDQNNGNTKLYNEYVSDVDFVKGAYGVTATEKWQTGLKLAPSYVMQIPNDLESVVITTKNGVGITLAGGDYVVIDTKKGKVTSVHGCESGWLDRTYVKLEDQLAKLKQ